MQASNWRGAGMAHSPARPVMRRGSWAGSQGRQQAAGAWQARHHPPGAGQQAAGSGQQLGNRWPASTLRQQAAALGSAGHRPTHQFHPAIHSINSTPRAAAPPPCLPACRRLWLWVTSTATSAWASSAPRRWPPPSAVGAPPLHSVLFELLGSHLAELGLRRCGQRCHSTLVVHD